MKYLKHSIQNLLNNLVEHSTSPRISTFTVLNLLHCILQSSALLRVLQQSWHLVTQVIITFVVQKLVHHNLAWLNSIPRTKVNIWNGMDYLLVYIIWYNWNLIFAKFNSPHSPIHHMPLSLDAVSMQVTPEASKNVFD